jgi:undecaprenyl-diphosphatase
MEYLQILILALIQGAAELLPVSSSAHVIVAAKLMGQDPSRADFVFLLIMLHTGTMFAVLVYFWPRWKRLLAPAPFPDQPSPRRQFLVTIIVATAFTGVVGLGLQAALEKVLLPRLLHKEVTEIEEMFRSLPLIAASLFCVGLLIIAAGFRENKSERSSIDGASASWIGIIQGLCLPFRGFSRSGATISTALFRGISRPLAEDFSFALAIILTPPLIVRQFLKLLKAPDRPSNAGFFELLGPGLLGMVFSFAAGWVALKVLSAVLENGRWRYFGYYCVAASAVVLGFAWQGY